jgi:hypothetical protein
MTKNNQINDNGYDMTDIYLPMIKYSWNAIFPFMFVDMQL